jgi:hypothetical protein
MMDDFEGCDSNTVFRAVRSNLANAKERTLWGSMRQEIDRSGVNGAISYLEGELTRVSAQLRHEIDRLKTEQSL